MSAKLKNIGSNFKKVDSHLIQPEEYEELPEITDEIMARTVYKINYTVLPSPRRRGPQKAPTKIALSIRLPQEVINYFKSEGAGWQTHISEILINWVKKRASKQKHF